MQTHPNVPKAAMPGGGDPALYQCIEPYVKVGDLMGKISVLKKKISTLKNLPLTKSEMLREMKQAHAVYCEGRIDRLAAELRNTKGHPFFNHAEALNLQPFIGWEEVERAVEKVAETSETMPEAKRRKEIEKLEAEIAELSVQAQEAMPGLFDAAKGQTLPLFKTLDDLVAHWAMVQQRCSVPVGPRATALSECSEAEQRAYKALGLASEINHTHGLLPYEPY